MNTPGIILASSSPRRRLLLRQIGISFDVVPADIGEEVTPGSDPADTVEALSLEKALRVAERGEDLAEHRADAHMDERKQTEQGSYAGKLVIGADTIVVLDGEILGKPADTDDAVSMLRSLSGRTHQVYTGVALVYGNGVAGSDGDQPQTASTRKGFQHHVFHERTDVTFGELTESEIRAYVESGSPMDKAGSYGIQDDLGALFVARIDGDYYNVVGFPLFRFYREVNKLVPGIVTPFVPATGNS